MSTAVLACTGTAAATWLLLLGDDPNVNGRRTLHPNLLQWNAAFADTSGVHTRTDAKGWVFKHAGCTHRADLPAFDSLYVCMFLKSRSCLLVGMLSCRRSRT
jgi:hypothetical protein